MITAVVQRWTMGRARWRPARELVDVHALEVAPLTTDHEAKAFVVAHHYERTYPAARFRFGLYERSALVGVAVFSHPVNERSLDPAPGGPLERVELGRLVLLDRVGANAESFFVARCFDELRRSGIAGVVSFSDPMPRSTAAGRVVMPGHVGIVYQASNATYLGRTRAERRLLLADGTILHNRALAKIRRRERGYQPIVARMLAAGAAELGERDDARAWLGRELARTTRAVRHPGNHKYVWALRARERRFLPASLPYPKIDRVREASTCSRSEVA